MPAPGYHAATLAGRVCTREARLPHGRLHERSVAVGPSHHALGGLREEKWTLPVAGPRGPTQGIGRAPLSSGSGRESSPCLLQRQVVGGMSCHSLACGHLTPMSASGFTRPFLLGLSQGPWPLSPKGIHVISFRVTQRGQNKPFPSRSFMGSHLCNIR